MRSLTGFWLVVVVLASPAPELVAQEESCPPADATLGVGHIVGRVVETESGTPLGFVRVHLLSMGSTDLVVRESATDGRFRYCSVPAGAVMLSGRIGQLEGRAGPLALESGATLELTLEVGVDSEAMTGTATLAGIVRDATTGEPLEGVALLLPGTGRSVASNETGRFTVPSLPPGVWSFRAERLGYEVTEGSVSLEDSRTAEVEVLMAVQAIDLAPIDVTATGRRVDLPDLDGFERRYNSGRGRFVLAEDIRLRNPNRLTDMLHEAGVSVTANGTAIRIRRTNCAPTVYLDGVKISRRPEPLFRPVVPRIQLPYAVFSNADATPEEDAASAVNLVHPSTVAAVEIYRGPAETPGAYIDSDSRCGVILVWTQRGKDLGGDIR